MFRRFASATVIERISLPDGKKLVFAEDTGKPISFDYDPENFVYFRCRAITADEPNGNGDLFPEAELRKSYRSFIGVGLYKDHDSDSIDKAIGKVIWADYVPDAKYVECICAVDKQLAPDLARRVEGGIATSVSMGCSVMEAQCGVPGCGNIAHNPNELCHHMIPGMGVKGRHNPDGSTIFEINRQIQFTELSLVTTPADPTARIFEVYAQLTKNKPMQYDDLISAIKNRMSGIGSQDKSLDMFARAALNFLLGRVAQDDFTAQEGWFATESPEAEERKNKEKDAAKAVADSSRQEQENAKASAERLKNLEKDIQQKRQEYTEFTGGGHSTIQPQTPAEVQEGLAQALPQDESLIKKIHEYTKSYVAPMKIDKLLKRMTNDMLKGMATYLESKGYRGLSKEDVAALERKIREIETASDMPADAFRFPGSGSGSQESQEVVAKKEESMEQRMGLSIKFNKGSSLAASFLVASDGKSSYRVSAADVLPIIVQQAIAKGEAGVISPQQLVADLQVKYSSIGDFKAWAKRRRKKNRKVMKTEESHGKETAEAKAAGTVDTAKPALTEEVAKPRVDDLTKGVQAAAQDNGRNEMAKKEELVKKASDTAIVETVKVETAPVVEVKKEEVAPVQTEAKPEDKMGEILAAFESLRKYVESRLTGETKREAVKVDSIQAPADGAHGDKAVDAGKGAIKEVTKVEQVKDHSDDVSNTKGIMPTAAKSEGLDKKAIDENWSLNQKELEKEPKMPKPEQSQPILMSTDKKELSSESVKADAGGTAGSTVKKFYNRLPSSGPGKEDVQFKSVDLKSGQNDEIGMLRKALDEEKAAKEKLLQKEQLQNIADKVYEVVTAMKDQGLLIDGKESAVIDTLTARFADLGQLEGLKTLVAHLSPRKAAVEGEKTETDLEVGKVVPQVFETVESGEDAVSFLSRVWNQ